MTSAGPRWLPLRFRDLDAFGHVYHAEYLTLLDEARSRWFADALGSADPEQYVVAHLEIDYLSSLRAEDDAVRVHHVVERVGTTSVTLSESMYARDGRLTVRSRTVAVLRDPATGRPRPVTDAERERAERHLTQT
jgi:acyl-CoA thioester hydrolase